MAEEEALSEPAVADLALLGVNVSARWDSSGVDRSRRSGYTATREFLRTHPDWIPGVEACLTIAKAGKGEFTGAWVLHEAQKLGVDWFPNLRPLRAPGILRWVDVTRAGRRGYYVILDPEGVGEALKEIQSGSRAQ